MKHRVVQKSKYVESKSGVYAWQGVFNFFFAGRIL